MNVRCDQEDPVALYAVSDKRFVEVRGTLLREAGKTIVFLCLLRNRDEAQVFSGLIEGVIQQSRKERLSSLFFRLLKMCFGLSLSHTHTFISACPLFLKDIPSFHPKPASVCLRKVVVATREDVGAGMHTAHLGCGGLVLGCYAAAPSGKRPFFTAN